MRSINVLANPMNMPQTILLLVIAGIFVVILIVMIYFFYVLVRKPHLRNEIYAKDREYKEEKKRLAAEKKAAEREIAKSSKEMDEKTKNAKKTESEADKMKNELLKQGIKEEEANKMAQMTLIQLMALKKKEATDVSSDFIINAITRRVLIDSTFKAREDVEDFKVPVDVTFEFKIEEVIKLLAKLPDVEISGAGGKKGATYKVLGKTFGILYDLEDNKFRLTLKNGPYYANRLLFLYNNYFEKSKFPYGMLWFSVNNLSKECSLELVKLLITISYNIAKAGY